jgi:hypothetical protein
MVVAEKVISPVADEARLQAFQASMRGQLIRSGDGTYDEARHVYSLRFDAGKVMPRSDHAPKRSLVRATFCGKEL